jgi:hypothetical protein
MKALPCSKKPISQKGRAKMGITQAELMKGIPDRYEVKIFLGPLKSWHMELRTHARAVLEIQTQRGFPKTWRNLDDAIAFSCEYCQGADRISIHYGELLFESTKI